MPLSIPAPTPIVAVRDVLPTLGFVPDGQGYSENPPAFKFRRSNLELTAGEMTNIYLRPGMHFYGRWQTPHTLKMVGFEMPLQVESYDQVLAWIAFGIGVDYQPTSDLAWFERGKVCQALLPWERHKRELEERSKETQRLRALRPHCLVSRKWMRLVMNHIANTARDSHSRLDFQLDFDGRLLKVEIDGELIGVPATGPVPWLGKFAVVLEPQDALPKRLMTDPVEIGIWQGHLEVERCKFRATEL